MTTARGLLLGIDAGQTVGKAALYDRAGRELAVGRAATAVRNPRERWVERDMDEIWRQVCEAVREALKHADAGPKDVAAVGICAHGDGLHLVDADLRPVRPAILATDSRAHRYAQRRSEGADGERLLELTGQVPYPAAPAALLAWLRDEEPESFDRIRWVLFCKDWIRLRLTGSVATDPTDACASFTDVHTQEWSDAALDAHGLGALRQAMPPIVGSGQVAGEVTAAAAAETGLAEGIPVVAGAHDVDGNALGIGAVSPGVFSVVLGTFSINQVVADHPAPDPRWYARSFVRSGQWLHMSTSPAGAGNLDWAVRQCGPWVDGTREPDPAAAVAEAMAAARVGQPGPLFLPFLYGSPHGAAVAASWVGIRGWHTRADLLRAVLEGVVFNHRTHVDALREVFDPAGAVRVCGGGVRSPRWTEMLAAGLDLPVEVTDAAEAGARGAALLAGVGTGIYPDLDAAVAETVHVTRRQEPDPAAVAELDARYARYLAVVGALSGLG